jgi:hypothetical protein
MELLSASLLPAPEFGAGGEALTSMTEAKAQALRIGHGFSLPAHAETGCAKAVAGQYSRPVVESNRPGEWGPVRWSISVYNGAYPS